MTSKCFHSYLDNGIVLYVHISFLLDVMFYFALNYFHKKCIISLPTVCCRMSFPEILNLNEMIERCEEPFSKTTENSHSLPPGVNEENHMDVDKGKKWKCFYLIHEIFT